MCMTGTIAILLLSLTAAAVEASEPPGVVIDTSPDFDRVYVGCPSIAVLPDGSYVASHSWFGPGTDNDSLAVFASEDRGRCWHHLADIKGQWWSNLFVHGEALYIMGVSKRYGHVVIRRSTDGGKTWTEPKDRKSGLLLGDAQYHTAPVPVVVHNGRVWRAMEDAMGGGGWAKHFRTFVMSAPVDADLLNADNWTRSNRLKCDQQRLGTGWLEGNMVVAPGGKLVNILRVALAGGDKGAVVRVSDGGKTVSFDPEHDFIDLPGGANKFTIRYDQKSGRYWSLANKEKDPAAYRNILALTSSRDLLEWQVESIILRHFDTRHHAWQYVDWLFDGQDMVAVSRTAWDGAHNAHDANYFTFHRIADFRDRTMDDSSPYLGQGEGDTYDAGDFTVTGFGFRVAKLANEAAAYANRDYVWQDVPQRFTGWKFTQTDGGLPARITVKARRDCEVFMASGVSHTGIDTSGWEVVEGVAFNYTARDRTPMTVYRRHLATDEEVLVPQGNWTGGIVLLPAGGR